MTAEQRKKVGEINKKRLLGTKQTEEVKRKRGIYKTGEEAPHWKGGHNKKELTKRWKQENRERNLLLNQNYRTRRIMAEGVVTLQEWNEIKKQFNFSCAKCKRGEAEKKLTIDHIVPLSKGGTNWKDNIQPLCLSCNSGKRDRI